MPLRAYRDLILELDILEDLRSDLIRQLEQHHRVVWSGMAPSDPMPVHVPLDKSLSQYSNVIERLTAIEAEIKIKKRLIQEVDEKLSKLSGLEQTIGYKRYVEGKSLKEIADEIGYSYSHVRNVVSESKVQSQYNPIAKT